MFYGLSHREEDFYKDNLYKFLAFAPCTIAPKDGPEEKWTDSLFKFPSIGVYNEYGPNWRESKKKIKTQLGSEALGVASCGWCKPVGCNSEIHWWQNTYSGRFQEFAPNWMEGEREMPLIPLDSIDKVPISMLVGTRDLTCPKKQARWARDVIGAAVTHYQELQGFSHVSFWTANDDWFVDLVVS